MDPISYFPFIYFPSHSGFSHYFPAWEGINAKPEGKKRAFFFAAWRKKNRMHVPPFFRLLARFHGRSFGKLVFSLRCNKQYVHLGQCCWFFSLFFWHSESGFALPSCQKSRENKTANIALGAQLLFIFWLFS